jgi:glycosyltransferase involved in cell wall biosynthesis
LFPSQWFECFPRVITEAFATGLPVLATDLGAHGEIASQLGPGWTVPAGGDTTPWVAALERLGTDSATVDRAGLATRRAYEQRYNAAAGVERLFSIYDRARAKPIVRDGLATSGGARG